MAPQDTENRKNPRDWRPRHRFLSALAGSRHKKLLPLGLRRFIKRRLLPYHDYMTEVKRAQDRNRDAEEVSTYPARVAVTLGIIKEIWQYHSPFIDACREMGVPYRLVDITGPDWVRVVREAPVDAFVVWPSVQLPVLKKMYDERLRLVAGPLGRVVYPTVEELWLYESKHRMHYWLEVNGFPHPRTWIFHRHEEAQGFARTCELPIVHKTDLGAQSSGVRIFRDRSALQRFIRRAFRTGSPRRGADPRDRQWGTVLLQEYLPDVKEWRCVRIHRTFFAHQKGKIGDFHSGTNIVVHVDPPRELLDLVRRTTDAGPFTSMDLDIFETTDGRFLISELQTLFGGDPVQMKIGGKPGRFLYDAQRDDWVFEEGMFNQNECCNLRVEKVLEILGKPVPQWVQR